VQNYSLSRTVLTGDYWFWVWVFHIFLNCGRLGCVGFSFCGFEYFVRYFGVIVSLVVRERETFISITAIAWKTEKVKWLSHGSSNTAHSLQLYKAVYLLWRPFVNPFVLSFDTCLFSISQRCMCLVVISCINVTVAGHGVLNWISANLWRCSISLVNYRQNIVTVCRSAADVSSVTTVSV